MSSGERVSSATITRLLEAGERLEIKGPGAWDGIQLIDLVMDLKRARVQRDRYFTQSHRLRRLIAHTVTSARTVLYEIAGGPIPERRTVTQKMQRRLLGKGTKPWRRGVGGPKRKAIIPASR